MAQKKGRNRLTTRKVRIIQTKVNFSLVWEGKTEKVLKSDRMTRYSDRGTVTERPRKRRRGGRGVGIITGKEKTCTRRQGRKTLEKNRMGGPRLWAKSVKITNASGKKGEKN